MPSSCRFEPLQDLKRRYEQNFFSKFRNRMPTQGFTLFDCLKAVPLALPASSGGENV